MRSSRYFLGACLGALLFIACSSTTTNYILLQGTDAGGGLEAGKRDGVGPLCQAYLDCCHRMPESAAATCNEFEKSLSQNLDALLGDYEALCERALDAAKTAGLCKETTGGDAGSDGRSTSTKDAAITGVCQPNCTSDLECQQTCKPPPSGVNCCDKPSGVCYAASACQTASGGDGGF